MSTNKLRLTLAVLLAVATIAPCAAQSPPPEEIRALWVDAFNPGIRSAAEADQLVADAKRAGINTLIVQVRRRGDALYTHSFEPPLDDPNYNPSFDALDYVLRVAHAAGLEVHAWINAMPVWRDATPPKDPRHAINRHGFGATGRNDWLTRSPAGETKFPVGYFLDPGHPDAAAYLTEVYLNIVRKYPVDAIHFDYIRYPETTERLPRGAAVGYNPVALARFRRSIGMAEDAAYVPAPGDEAWMSFRRQQVTQLVRRIYIEAKAINPRIKVSAALIPWGKPPATEKDFVDAAPMQRIFQDWHGWLKEGILDVAIPMNYAREHDPVVRGWFDGWIKWEKRHKHERQLAVGLGAYVNTPANTLTQIGRVRGSEGRHRADGVSFFSYANLFPRPAPSAAATAANATPSAVSPASTSVTATPPASTVPAGSGSTGTFPVAQPSDAAVAPAVKASAPVDRLAFLFHGAESAPPAFATPARVPKLPWIEQPTRGMLAGSAADGAGKPLDGAVVRVKRSGWFSRSTRITSDGNGFFGAVNLKPGKYRLRLEASAPGARRLSDPPEAEVEISAGRVSRASLALPAH